jgi:hypothetical protein
MSNEIESIKPALSVILDDGDFIINSTGPIGKAMTQAILSLTASAKKVVVIADGEMKVMKRGAGQAGSNGNGSVKDTAAPKWPAPGAPADVIKPPLGEIRVLPSDPAEPDIQDQFAADLEAGVTGELAMGETPSPTPGPSDPTPVPSGPKPGARRSPRIFQDGAAPPAPELAEQEMAQLLAEAAQAEVDAARAAEDRRFQQQQAVQAGAAADQTESETDPAATSASSAAKPSPRRREPRVLALTGRPCGKCGGSGVGGTQDPSGQVFTGPCSVCGGKGQVQSFDRGPKFR